MCASSFTCLSVDVDAPFYFGHTHTRADAHAHAHTQHTRAHTHTHTRARTHNTRTYTHAHTHNHTHTHTRAPAHTHTHTHTHTPYYCFTTHQMCSLSSLFFVTLQVFYERMFECNRISRRNSACDISRRKNKRKSTAGHRLCRRAHSGKGAIATSLKFSSYHQK
jgi:hypothetical protein